MHPNPLGQGVLDLHWNHASKDTMSELLKLSKEDHVQKHRADYDAYYQALIFIELLKRMESYPKSQMIGMGYRNKLLHFDG